MGEFWIQPLLSTVFLGPYIGLWFKLFTDRKGGVGDDDDYIVNVNV